MVTTNPLDAVSDLQAVVTQLTPSLRPQVLPKGSKYGLDVLLRLCVSEQQQKTLRDAIHDKSPADAKSHGRSPYVVGAFDVARRVFNVEAIAWLTEEEAFVHEFPRFVELQLEDQDAAQQIISLFLQRNGHDEGDVAAAQQCFNAAFALQTILRAFPLPLITINGRSVEIDESADVSTLILGALYPSKVKKTKTDKPPSQQKPSKSKKRKAGSKA